MSGQPIWIGDSNLFGTRFGRRYLLCLAAQQGVPLAVAQAMLRRNELPAGLVRPFATGALHRAGFPGRSSRTQQRVALTKRLIPVGADAVDEWLRLDAAREQPMLRVLPDTEEARDLAETVSLFCKRASGDVDIIGQTIAAGGAMIATDNFDSIDHASLDEWWNLRGRNEPLLVDLPQLSRSLLPDPVAEAALVAVAFAPADPAERTRQAFGLAAGDAADILGVANRTQQLGCRVSCALRNGLLDDVVEQAMEFDRRPRVRLAVEEDFRLSTRLRRAARQALDEDVDPLSA